MTITHYSLSTTSRTGRDDDIIAEDETLFVAVIACDDFERGDETTADAACVTCPRCRNRAPGGSLWLVYSTALESEEVYEPIRIR